MIEIYENAIIATLSTEFGATAKFLTKGKYNKRTLFDALDPTATIMYVVPLDSDKGASVKMLKVLGFLEQQQMIPIAGTYEIHK